MTTFAYLRVSTDRQDVANQRHGLFDYANTQGMGPLRFVEDATSGRVAWRERAIGQLLSATATPGDVALVAEISRRARSTLQVLEMLALGMERQLYIHIAKQQMILDGSLNSRITATVLGLAAEMERELIAARTREALAKRRADGKPLGRPRGATSARLKLDTHADKIRRYVGKGLSKRSIAKLVGCAESTFYDWFAPSRVATRPSQRHAELGCTQGITPPLATDSKHG